MISGIGKVNYTRNIVILNTLAACGYKVIAIAPGSLDNVENDSSITHYPLSLPNANFWYDAGLKNTLRAIGQRTRNVFALFRKIGQVRPDVLLCSEPDAWLVAIFAKKRYGCKIIVDLQEVYEDRALAFPLIVQGLMRKLLKGLMRILSNYTDAIIHVSQERQQVYSYLYKSGTIIGSYPELRLFTLQDTQPVEERSDFVTAIHVGALRQTYASEQLLDAMTIVAGSMSNVRFVVLGGIAGTLVNANLVDLLKGRGVLEFVQQVPFSEVVRRLSTSDIGINLVLPVDTSHRLAAPQKLYEYFAASLPVVAADVPTIHRVVTEHKCGIVVDSSSPNEIANALIRLAQDGEMRRRMGMNARRAAEDDYNWETQASKLCILVDSLMNKPVSPEGVTRELKG